MAYIEPNSELRLLAGINIDQDYNHTLFFNSREKQAAFFKSRTVKTFDKLSYQRKERGYIRVNCIPEEVYGCNYMMYKNTNFDPQNLERWIYCFVESIEYINNNCAEIHYTVDRMQTWMFDYKLGDCLVDREHTLTDNIGQFLTPDNITPFDMTINTEQGTSAQEVYEYFAATVILQKNLTDVEAVQGGGWDQITYTAKTCLGYTPGNYFGYVGIPFDKKSLDLVLANLSTYEHFLPRPDMTLANFLLFISQGKFRGQNYALQTNTTSRDDIVGVYVYPLEAMRKTQINYEDDNAVNSASVFSVNMPTKFQYRNNVEYTPRNAKLFTSPYCYPVLSDITGDNCSLKYELFNDDIEFRKETNIIGSGQTYIHPVNYQGQIQYKLTNLLIDHPLDIIYQSSNVGDYIRDNKLSLISASVGAITGLLGGATQTVSNANKIDNILSKQAQATARQEAKRRAKWKTGRPRYTSAKHEVRYQREMLGLQKQLDAVDAEQPTFGDMISSADDLMEHAVNALNASLAPNKVYGKSGTGNVQAALKRVGYMVYSAIPVLESAQQIDDYFDRFGYKLLTTHRPYVDEAKTNDRPVSDLRGVWNYIKTVDCVVHHSNPDSAAIGYSAQDEAIIASIYNKGITFWFDNEKIGDYNNYRNANSIFNPQPGPTPPPTPQFDDNVLSGIDISRFQSSCDPYNPDRVYGVMDLEDLMTQVAGPQFCIARAGGSDGGDGTIFIDPVFTSGTLNDGTPFSGYATQMWRAKQTKPQIKFGVYWATGANTVEEMQAECDVLLQLLRTWNVDADLGVFLDIELPRSYNAGASMCDAIFRKFAEVMGQNGYTPWLYTYRSFFENRFIGPWYRNGGVKVAISAPYNEDMNYVGTPPTEAIDDVSSGAYSFIPTTKGAWQYGKSNRWTDYNGAYMDGDYFYWKGVSK